jgi:hypothetical protein
LEVQATRRIQKLDVVTNYIKNNFSIGSIDNPNEYFQGTLPMRWMEPVKGNLVLFVGKTNETSLALTGSSYHMLGSLRESSMSSSGSRLSISSILEALVEASRIPVTQDKIECDIPGIRYIMSLLKGPEVKMEFLARKLYYEKFRPEEQNVLLGTPIYVSSVGG